MNYFLLFILYGISKIKGERSIYSLYHLFKGKRSAQTIQDAQLFQLYHLFGVVPNLDRNELDLAVAKLCAKNDVVRMQENHVYCITNQGEKSLASFQFPASLNGRKYANSSIVFWERLSLSIQSLSYLIRYETRFVPINRDPNTLVWVKNFLKQQPKSRQEVADDLYSELLAVLKQNDELQATIFVNRLTSVQRIGNTIEQIANKLQIHPLQVRILFLSTIHYFLRVVEENKNDYPLLAQLAYIKDQETVMTYSTQKTYELLQDGRSIEEIANIRKLKRNTIEDHIVEIALTDVQFDTTRFIEDELFLTIKKGIEREKTNQLKRIKQSLQLPVSYFEIRLVLAKVGGAYATRKDTI